MAIIRERNEKYAYTKSILSSVDRERHIPLNEAYSLIEAQEDENLPASFLKDAVQNGQLHVYEFNGQEYVDRLDIGRVYHQQNAERDGLKVERYFTKGIKGIENVINSAGPYIERNLKLIGAKNETIWQTTAYFPESWDENQAKIVAQKYFFNPNKPEWKEKIQKKIGSDNENALYHLAKRVTNFFADEGEKLGYFSTDEDKENFRDELLWLQLHRKGAFNSPVQFNAGIYNEYEIKGSHGINYWRNPETGEVIKIDDGEYIHPQCHACFIKGPRDDLESIAEHAVHEIGIFSAGSGIGQDIGALRAEGEKLSGGGIASGPLSYLEFYDDVAGSIKSGGKSRRAARMTVMGQSHPDIMKFIRAKVKEDKKALTLMKAGYSPGMDGEACTTVAFQNTNLSVRLDDNFFEQLKKGGEIELYNVNDRTLAGKISAEEIMKELSFGAWRVGDPGMQYESKIQEMHTCKNSGKQKATNPCGEYMFLNDTSCNLASLNLLAFSDDKGNFDINSFIKAAKIFSIAQDIANDSASYPVYDIAEISPEFRTIGLGFANLSSLLMRKGYAYDSEEGRALAGAIGAVLTGASYQTSTELAEKIGTFDHFELNKSSMLEVMSRHKKSLENIAWGLIKDEKLKKEAYELWDSVISRMDKFGSRNAQATVLAPTGTISYYLGSEDSTGLEPAYALTVQKNLAGGGELVLGHKEIPNSLKNLGYSNNQIYDIIDYIKEKVQKNGKEIPRNVVIGAPHLNPEHYGIFSTALGDGMGIGNISFAGHVKMMGALQPFISGGISKTNNMPEEATVKNVYDAFVLGHELGLKGITIFRNESKPSSAMKLWESGFTELKRGEVEEPFSERTGPQIEVKINGTPLHMLIGEYNDGRPAQITFLSYTAGSTLKALLETHGIAASKALKRGVNLEDVVSGWIGQTFEPNGFVTIENPRGPHEYIKTALSPLDFAAKWLKLNYLGDVSVATEPGKVNLTKLRGFENGAFETYWKMKIDDWDIHDVLRNPDLGGFIKDNENGSDCKLKDNGNRPILVNMRGVSCTKCGNIMRQTSSNCYECPNCADKRGGCGQ